MMTNFTGNENAKGREVVYRGSKMLHFGSIIILSSTSLSKAQFRFYS
jgi:hypothetical protein